MTEPAEEKFLDTLDGMVDEVPELLSSMVQIPTVNPPGEYQELARFIDDTLKEAGLESEIIEVPEEVLAKHEISVPKYNVIGKYRGREERPALYLNAHLDTVSPECIPGDLELWTVPPFGGLIKDEKVWGRGACDSKGRMAAYIAVILALKRAAIELEGSVLLAATADEETGLSAHTGAGYLGGAGMLRGDFAIVEGYSYEIYYANSGEIWLRIVTRGDSLHTSQVKDGGVNANHEMVPVLNALMEFQKELKSQESSIPNMGYTIVNIGRVEGGLDGNMTASQCVAEVSIAPTPEHEPQEIIASIRERLNSLQAENEQLQVKLEVVNAIPAVVSEKESKVALALQHAAADLFGTELGVVGLSGRSDLIFFVQAGMEAVNFGPARLYESNLHLPDENVRIQDLVDTAKIIGLAAIRLLGPKMT